MVIFCQRRSSRRSRLLKLVHIFLKGINMTAKSYFAEHFIAASACSLYCVTDVTSSDSIRESGPVIFRTAAMFRCIREYSSRHLRTCRASGAGETSPTRDLRDRRLSFRRLPPSKKRAPDCRL